MMRYSACHFFGLVFVSIPMIGAQVSTIGAQTINYTPPRMVISISSDGGSTYSPYTAASGIGPINYTPQPFVPMCSSTGLPPFSQCDFSNGGGGSTPGGATNSVQYNNAGALGGVGNSSATPMYLRQINGAAPTFQQIAASELSGLAPSATTDTTNANNIASGTLGAARLPNSGVTTINSTACTIGQSCTITAAAAIPNPGPMVNTDNSATNVDSVVSPTTYGHRFMGDSITAGQGSSSPGTMGYAALMAADLGLPIGSTGTTYAYPVVYNYAVSGSNMCDQTNYLLTSGMNPGDTGNPTVSMAAGTNDLSNGPTAQYQACALGVGAWLGTSSSNKFAPSTATQTSGTFTADNTYSQAPGLTTIAASVLTYTVQVTTPGVVYVIYKMTNSNPASFSVSVDGTLANNTITGNTTVSYTGNPFKNVGTGFAVARYAMPAGSHTVALNWISGTVTYYGIIVPPIHRYRGVSTPKILIGGVPPEQNNANAAATIALQQANQAVSQRLVNDGLNAPFVDLFNNLDPVVDFANSFNPGLHPGNVGHRHLAGIWEAALGAVPSTFSPSATQTINYNIAQPVSTLSNSTSNPGTYAQGVPGDNRSYPSTGSVFPASTQCASTNYAGLACTTSLDFDSYFVGINNTGLGATYLSYVGPNGTPAQVKANRKQKFLADGSFDMANGFKCGSTGICQLPQYYSVPGNSANPASGVLTLSGDQGLSIAYLNGTVTSVVLPTPANANAHTLVMFCQDNTGGRTLPSATTAGAALPNLSLNGTPSANTCAGQAYVYITPPSGGGVWRPEGTPFVPTGTFPVPSIAPGTAAGTGATATITGANMAGRISITTGTGTTANATLATITFAGTVTTAPQGCSLQAVGANANGQVAMVAPGGYPTTTGWTIAVAGNAIPASTTYTYSYNCQ